MAHIILFTIIIVVAISANSGGCGIKCFSFSCRHNKGGRCRKNEIVVYDNTVTGLCLYHTDNMNDRVIEPMRKGGLLEEAWIAVHKLAKTRKNITDDELLKNPRAFSIWMKRHGMRSPPTTNDLQVLTIHYCVIYLITQQGQS